MTKKPRLTITLEKHQREILGRIAKANGVPASRIISDIFDAVTPYLERVVVVVEQAAKLKGKSIAAPIIHALGKAEGRALQLHEDVLGQVDLFIANAGLAGGVAPVADAQRPAPPPPTPVPSNHGGQVVRKRPRRSTKGAPKSLAKGVKRRGGRPHSASQSGRRKP